VHDHDNDLDDREAIIVTLVKYSPRRVKQAILRLLDHREEQRLATPPPTKPGAARRGDPVIRDPAPEPRYPNEGDDEPDLSAPVGDRMYVPQELLDNDGKELMFRGVDPETGEVVEGTAPLVIAPEVFKEAARRRGVDVDA